MLQHELTERILRLRGVPTLRSLPANELALIARSLQARTFEPGEILLNEEDPPRSFFLVTSGRVTMRRRGARIGTIRAPGGVGFMSLLARNAGGTAAVAETFVEALELRGDTLEEVFEDHFPVLLGTVRFVAERMIHENIGQPPPPYIPPDVAFDHLVGDRELGIVERIFLLRRMRAFTEANVNSLATMARKMVEIRAPAGEVLWRPGDRAEHNFFVVKGVLSSTWKIPGGGAAVQQIGPGYVVGGAESLCSLPRWNELVTGEPVVMLRGDRDGLIDLMEDDRDLALRFLSMLAGMLMTTWDKKAEAGIPSIGGAPDSVPPPPDSAYQTPGP
ncbi:MAG: cyclic nucleotide-binding domain-containing protein [Labilithrix sp.]|nr:cyclic nucleotide-binding domain-containing protein [Labilithrix sp.]